MKFEKVDYQEATRYIVLIWTQEECRNSMIRNGGDARTLGQVSLRRFPWEEGGVIKSSGNSHRLSWKLREEQKQWEGKQSSGEGQGETEDSRRMELKEREQYWEQRQEKGARCKGDRRKMEQQEEEVRNIGRGWGDISSSISSGV